ncbi:MAG: hydrolase [Oscillospiraceae bacterium]|nr:MAG: hydrolase [Oscillospiraceae bacterium]
MRICSERCAAVAIDFQARLLAPMRDRERLLHKSAELLEGCSLLSIPVLFTEQYPAGLGKTDPVLLALAPGAPVVEKTAFGATLEPGFLAALRALDRDQIILLGIEAHICVLQTAIGLREAGFSPVLAVDCISSRGAGDCAVALERAKQEGILLSSCEALLFEWTVSKQHPRFREISSLVKRSECF